MSQNNTERGANPMTAPPAGALEACLALLEKAGAFDLATAQYRDEGMHDCPLCHGEGAVDGNTYTNFDGVASGVQFFGIGDALTDKEAAFKAAVNLLRTHGPALLAALRLREGCQELVTSARRVEQGDRRDGDEFTANRIGAFADDLARVLEEGE